jgi:hypothetical protein
VESEMMLHILLEKYGKAFSELEKFPGIFEDPHAFVLCWTLFGVNPVVSTRL